MTPANTLFALFALITLAVHSLPSANADLVVTEDLGVLAAASSTAISGDTAAGANNCDTYTAAGGINTWGNEIVFQFTINETMRIDITSVALGGDPDVFILNTLETEVNAAGLIDSAGALNLALLDGAPPRNATLGLFRPGTYYISVDSFGGDATFTYNLIATAGDFPDEVTELGVIAEANAPFTIDTIGNTIDTELGVWNALGTFLFSNDDAPRFFDGDGFVDIYQSQISFTGLSAGTYYVAAGSWNTLWTGSFTFVGGSEGGTLTFNYGPTPADVVAPTPAENSVTGELAVGGVLWYSFEIAPLKPPTPPEATELGVIAEANAPFTIDTIGNTIDTELGVWNALGTLLAQNDDAPLDFDGDGFADIYQSQISFTGLPAGTYYVAVGSWNSLWTGPFTFVGGSEGGTLTFNYGPTPADVVAPTPAENSVTGELAVGGVLWYSFEIGTITPPTPLQITNITRNAEGQVNITFNSVEGREYGVDITTDIKEWQELTDGLVGEADNTTYTHASPDLAARFLYYRIRQLSAAPPQ
jgi:hypothetical protein